MLHFVFKQKYICHVFKKLNERDTIWAALYFLPLYEKSKLFSKFDPQKQVLPISIKQHSLVDLFVSI